MADAPPLDSPAPGRPSGVLLRLRRPGCLVLTLVLVGAALVFSVFTLAWLRPRITDRDVDTAVLTTLTREAPASFLVTGTLEFATTSVRQSTRSFEAGPIQLPLSTTTVTVRVPGRAAYGFDVRTLRAEHIRLAEDGWVEVEVPALTVFSVEPDLERTQVQTQAGWAQAWNSPERRLVEGALAQIQRAMRAQAAGHLRTSPAPRANTAEALRAMLTPPLEAAGLAAPRFRFRLGPEAVLELRGRGD
ncbi:MAG TPA: DUF4230 domain-containing protein [Rubricoccaceae bacterium]|nr:DUF4230 domain-containing protein [Rubricoccaceae bacterium]